VDNKIIVIVCVVELQYEVRKIEAFITNLKHVFMF